MSDPNAAIVNSGWGAWAFEEHARRLATALRLPVVETPVGRMYLLGWEGEPPAVGETFIPFSGIVMASDKRLQAEAFSAHGVATPTTHLLATPEDVRETLHGASETEWVLKYPTGCGAGGHRRIGPAYVVPVDWPRPYILQEFIRLREPEVYRLYAAGGALFGWNARRFPAGVEPSPWVAHARGARYVAAGTAPLEAELEARGALEATGLHGSFGCVDLLQAPDGRCLVLEVGTDGVFNHVDRDIDIPGLAEEIDARIAEAFWAWLGVTPPWGSGPSRPHADPDNIAAAKPAS